MCVCMFVIVTYSFHHELVFCTCELPVTFYNEKGQLPWRSCLAKRYKHMYIHKYVCMHVYAYKFINLFKYLIYYRVSMRALSITAKILVFLFVKSFLNKTYYSCHSIAYAC